MARKGGFTPAELLAMQWRKENMEAIKEISRLTTAPIALGERLHSRWDFKRFLEAGAVDIAQPDISHCGGISEMRRIATMCEAYGAYIL